MKKQHILVLLTAIAIFSFVISTASAGLFHSNPQNNTTSDENNTHAIPSIEAKLKDCCFKYDPLYDNESSTDSKPELRAM